jgi:cobalt-zinc-cadmium efflux system protein
MRPVHAHHHGHGHGGHAHGHRGSASAERRRGQRGLLVALCLTLSIFAVEVVGGLAAGSLALLADAGHVLADAIALALALAAGWLAGRPAGDRRTFGWQRVEILVAFGNGVALGVIAAAILVEAARRLGDPPDVAGGLTLAVAAAGLAVNLTAGAVLHRAGDGLNVRAAMRHVLADALSSVGVIVSAAVIIVTGWEYADPAASVLIGLLVLLSAAGIVRESVDVLLESAPAGVDVTRLGRAMASVDGVVEVHDLHVWTVTSGFPAVAAHVTVASDAEPSLVRRRTAELLRNHFGIEHSTLQVERQGDETRLLQIRPRR